MALEVGLEKISLQMPFFQKVSMKMLPLKEILKAFLFEEKKVDLTVRNTFQGTPLRKL